MPELKKSPANRLDAIFGKGRKAFIPYITAGFPSVAETVTVMRLLADNGADIIELGFPFSDPTADGPVIQASSQAALDRGFKRTDYFQIVRDFRAHDQHTPVVVFSYYNPIFRHGTERFVAEAKAAGVDAFLVVDLPLEEQDEIRPALDAHGLHLIQLIAPTTPDERARRVLANATGFVYQIALRGVTGIRQEIASDALANVARTRHLTALPVAMGFGVGRGDQAKAVAAAADGVIVGSAVVKCLTDHGVQDPSRLIALTRELADATHAG
jgi:tryptophan synthase alpha chain